MVLFLQKKTYVGERLISRRSYYFSQLSSYSLSKCNHRKFSVTVTSNIL